MSLIYAACAFCAACYSYNIWACILILDTWHSELKKCIITIIENHWELCVISLTQAKHVVKNMVKHGKTTVAVIFRLKRFKKSNKTFIFASAAGCYLSTLFWSTSSARETEGLEETPSASSWVSHSEKKKFTNINLAHDFSHHLISCWLLCYTYHLESISMTVCDGIHQGGLRCETTWQFYPPSGFTYWMMVDMIFPS